MLCHQVIELKQVDGSAMGLFRPPQNYLNSHNTSMSVCCQQYLPCQVELSEGVYSDY